MKTNIIAILLTIALWSCVGETTEPDNLGTIEGKVTISPLCGNIPKGTANPLNPCGLSDAAINEIYGAYKVTINSAVGATKAVTQEKVLDKTGQFSFELPEGDYKVQVLKKDGSPITTSSDLNQLSKSIKLVQNQKVAVDLYVDTGIK